MLLKSISRATRKFGETSENYRKAMPVISLSIVFFFKDLRLKSEFDTIPNQNLSGTERHLPHLKSINTASAPYFFEQHHILCVPYHWVPSIIRTSRQDYSVEAPISINIPIKNLHSLIVSLTHQAEFATFYSTILCAALWAKLTDDSPWDKKKP